jgi:L-amino acid N-acyltransferase YncA
MMAMNIIVRPMNIDDYEQVHMVDILTQKQYLGEKFDQMSEEEQDSHLVSRKSEFQTNVDTGFCFVAEGDKRIVGFVLAHETLPFYGTLYIHYIGLDPKLQGKGIGLLLYKKLIEKAEQTGIKKVWGLINTDNPSSIKLHKKAGFKINDRKEAVLKISK